MPRSKKIEAVLSVLLLSIILAAYAGAATVKRSNFIVGNLSCTSCLATIETELQGIDGALGMDADLSRSMVIVDHLDTLSHEQIAEAISRLGYPAVMEWTGTLSGQYTNRFAGQNRYGSGCSSGGCGGSGGNTASPQTWNSPQEGSVVSRTTLKVGNLSCSSCLSNIAAELAKLSNTYGMNGYLSRGIIIVDHANDLESSRVAAVISGLGYPAKALVTNFIPARKAFASGPGQAPIASGTGRFSGCNTSGPCNATAASWQKLYKRYFTKTDTN